MRRHRLGYLRLGCMRLGYVRSSSSSHEVHGSFVEVCCQTCDSVRKAHLPSLTDATKGRACSHADAYSCMRHVHARCIRFVNATLLSSSQHCPECRRCACHLASASRSRPASPPLTCRRRQLGRRARRRSQTCRPRGTSWSCSGSSSPHRECQAPHGTAASSLHTAG